MSEGRQSLHCLPSEQLDNVHLVFQTTGVSRNRICLNFNYLGVPGSSKREGTHSHPGVFRAARRLLTCLDKSLPTARTPHRLNPLDQPKPLPA